MYPHITYHVSCIACISCILYNVSCKKSTVSKFPSIYACKIQSYTIARTFLENVFTNSPVENLHVIGHSYIYICCCQGNESSFFRKCPLSPHKQPSNGGPHAVCYNKYNRIFASRITELARGEDQLR